MIYLFKMVIVRYVKLPEGNQSVDHKPMPILDSLPKKI